MDMNERGRNVVNSTEQRIDAAALRLFAARGRRDVTMSELAVEARIARGTLYRSVDSIEHVYQRVVENLARYAHRRVAAALAGVAGDDSAVRLATALRLVVRLADENPAGGHFVVRFGLTEGSLRGILAGVPMQDVASGRIAGLYRFPESGELSVASLLIGATVGAIWMVLEGHQGWREAGTATAVLLLRALGVSLHEAERVATLDLPDLPND
jgi:AcrR family transcriptional regulator